MKKLLLIPFVFILSLITVTSQALTVDDAIAVYRFEEGTGSVCGDSTSNNLDGTINGTTFITSKGNNGTGGFATRYDGVDDFCQVQDNALLNLTMPFSISMWVNKTDVGDNDFFIYKNVQGTDSNFGIESDGVEQVTVFQRVFGETTRAVITTSPLPTDVWVHIVAIVNGTGSTDAFIYFDGIQQATVAGGSNGLDAFDEDLYIGTDADLTNDFDGDIDEVYIFNFSLSDTQITDLFNNGLVRDLNTTNLDVFLSKNPVEILEQFTLFANYTNATDNQPILNATCFANSSISGGGQSGFGRGVLGIGGLSTIGNAIHTQLNDIFANNTLRVDIDNIPLGKASYGISFRFHAHNQTPDDDLRVFATCHNNLTFSNFTLIDQVNVTEVVISTSDGNDTIWGFKNVVLFGASVATENCSIVFESQNTSIDKHWMIADTTSNLNLNNSFTSDNFGETYTLRTNANERSPFVDAGFGLDVPNETTMLFNSTSGLYFLNNIRHGRPFDFIDRVFCSADNFLNATDFVITNVQDNVAPIVQIISIVPTVAVINVSNVTIEWTANDPELVTNFINVSFPNGSLVIETDVKPLILTPAQLPVLGNYSVVAFGNDTGGLTSTANATFEVADVDITPPVIILIAPTNNSVNNTIPLPITFQVTDNFPNDIICDLRNSSTLFDIDTFTQAVNSVLILAEGEISLSQQFPNLELTCFDNSELNNSATLNLNYTLDTIPPVIFPISPGNESRFNKDIVTNINIKANCTDVPVFRLNLTISNTSDTIASFESRTSIDNFIVIDEQLNIQNLGVGNYTIDYTCSDPHTKKDIPDYDVSKKKSEDKLKWITDNNEYELKYNDKGISVLNYGSAKHKDNDKYYFWYRLNETEGTKRTFTFELENKKFSVYYLPNSPYKGHFIMGDNWIDFEFGDPDAEYFIELNDNDNYEISITTRKTLLNFSSTGELNIATLETEFEIFFVEQVEDLFQVSVCRTDTGSVLLLGLFFLIAFGLIGVGLSTKIGFIGVFGAVMLLITSWFIASCIAILTTLLALLAILFFFYFIFRGFFPNMFQTR